MKMTIIKVAGIVVGVGVSIACCGYFVWKHVKGKKLDDDANKPIEVEHFSYDPRKFEEVKSVIRDDDDHAKRETDINKKKFAEHLSKYMASDDEKENLESYLAGMESPEEESDDNDIPDDDEDDGQIRYDPAFPYLISAAEFCNTRTYYDKISLNYFAEDDVVSDDRDEVMENAMHVLGDVGERFKEAGNPNVIYIRSDELEADYEISYVDGSYAKEVLNIDEE